MGTKVNSNYEDLLTFTRASKGHALRPVSYGSELVTNGTFDSDTNGWTAFLGTLSNVNSTLKVTATSSYGYAYQSLNTVVGKIYKVSVDLVDAGTTTANYVQVGTIAVPNSILSENIGTTTGTYTFIFVATDTANVVRVASGSGAGLYSNWDNISVKEVTFDESDGTLTLFEHPNNIPRVEWDADRNRLGLLVEEARTNLIYGSTSPPTDGSSKNPSNKILSPTQEVNADLVVENTSTSAHGVRRTNVFPTQGATDYTISVFAKAKERRYLQLRMYANGTSNDVFGFDLQEGTAPAGGSIQDVGNGWYRCSATLSVDNSTGGFDFAAAQMGSDSLTYYYAGDGSSGMYIFGLQVEAGGFPTSYIKNEGLSGGVTRSADVASIPVADFGFNDDGYSFVIEAEVPYAVEINQDSFFVTLDGDVDLYMYANNTGTQGSYQLRSNSGADLVLAKNDVTITDLMKMGFGFKKNDCALTLNGAVSTTDTSATLPTGVTDLLLGRSGSVGQKFVHIKSIKYYPRRLTNAQLQALTEPRSTPTLSLTFDGLESSYTENYIHG